MKKAALIIITVLPFCMNAQIQLLNDEFDDATSLSNWQNVTDVEGWGAEHLEVFDINTTTPGQLHLMPWSTGWFEDYRSTLLFKEVTGDFVFSTEVTATNRAGTGIPSSDFSLAGPMIRTPRNFNNGNNGWAPGGENYVFLSIGQANDGFSNPPSPGPHFEVKTTEGSVSTLEVTPVSTNQNVQIRIAKIGQYVICMYKLPGDDWTVRIRYDRPDMPDTLQAGLVAYTDWWKYSTYTHAFAHENVINANLNPDPSSEPWRPFNPDLVGTFEFARFDTVNVPPPLAGLDLSDPNVVSDADLLGFLGFPSQPYIPNNIQYIADLMGIEILPDPVNEFVNVVGDLSGLEITVVNAMGMVVEDYTGTFGPLVIDTSELPAGLHFLIIEDPANSSLRVENIIKAP